MREPVVVGKAGRPLGATLLLASPLVMFLACSTSDSSPSDPNTGSVATALVCSASPPAGAWVCGQDMTFECTSPSGTPVSPLYVHPVATGDAGAPSCTGATFVATPTGPFPLGTTTVVVAQTTDAGVVEACRSNVTVRDTTPPLTRSFNDTMWPPDHSMHHFTIGECFDVTDKCDPHVAVRFTYATSDEPVDVKGSGNTGPDIAMSGCDAIDLRAERAGGGDGRVYTLGWHAEDASGNAVDGACHVRVPHDQSGRPAVDSGPAYRVSLCP
jgi:hypothetical protein